LCRVERIDASRARLVNDAEGDSGVAPGCSADLLEAVVCSARFNSRLSVNDRLVHGDTRKFRNRP